MKFVAADLNYRETQQLTQDAQERTYLRIDDYAVNEDGSIAVASSEYINVYQPDGGFQTCYLLDTNSGAYALEFDGDALWLYFLRKDEAMLLQADGTAEVYQLTNAPTVKMEASRLSQEMRKSRTIGETRYTVNGSLTELTVTDGTGISRTVYRTQDGVVMKDSLVAVCIVLAALAVICIAYIKNRREAAGSDVPLQGSTHTDGTATSDTQERQDR